MTQMREILMDVRAKLFHTTVRIVQDIVQDSSAKTQLLISEMQKANVDDKLINYANDISERSNLLLNSLYNLDPLSMKSKDTADILKIFEVNKK